MSGLIFLFVVIAVVACAAQSQGQAQSSRPRLATSKAISGLESHLSTIAVHGAAGDTINKAIEKVKKIIEDIRRQIVSTEEQLESSLQSIAIKIADKLSDVIYRITNIRLDLSGDWLALEAKVRTCGENAQPEVQALVTSIKDKAMTCASKEIADAKTIEEQIVKLFKIMDTVPERAIKNIKKCGSSSPPSDDSSSSSSSSSSDSGDATTTTPATDNTKEDSTEEDVNVNLLAGEIDVNTLRLRGLPSMDTVKCVSHQLMEALKGMKHVPELVYDLVKEIKSLTSKKTQQELQACAATSLVGSSAELRKAAAELATCIIEVSPSTSTEA